MLKKRGQIWIETVIYTLIGLTIIGILLSIVTPKINQMTDKSLVIQSINALNSIDGQVSEIMMTPGNSREIDLFFKKGEYIINGLNGTISYQLSDTGLLFSQLNKTISQGEVNILTIQKGSSYTITASLNYGYLNLTYNNQNINKSLSGSPTGYKLIFENLGETNGKTQINIPPV
jgi:type II secretory pathway pseudopilin PulG